MDQKTKEIVTRMHLATALAPKIKIGEKKCYKMIGTLLDTLKECLEKKEKVKIHKFGNFYVSSKAPRMGRNPQTMEPALICARKVIKLKYAKTLTAYIRSKVK